MPRLKAASRSHAIIDDRRIGEASSFRRCPGRHIGGGGLLTARIGCGVRPGIQWPASSGHPKCRERATYVRGPGHCEPPDGRRRSKSEPGCGVRSRGVRSSPADRIREGEKNFCCVTTRGRNFRVLNGLGRGLGSLTALLLGLGMLGFDAVHPDDVQPGGEPPASGGLPAGIPGPGSSAGSSVAAGTCVRILCESKSARRGRRALGRRLCL